jgi:hypothetical protein
VNFPASSAAQKCAGSKFAPWCVEHLGGVCFSERRRAGGSHARLARFANGPITVMVRAEDPKANGRSGCVQVSLQEARELAIVLRVLGHAGLCKAIMLTVREA